MRFQIALALLLTLLATSACATTSAASGVNRNPQAQPYEVKNLDDDTLVTYDEALGYFLEKSADELVKEAGKPFSIRKDGDGIHTIYEYVRGQKEGERWSQPLGRMIHDDNMPYCSTMFWVKDGVVESFRYEGNACGTPGLDEMKQAR